MARVNDKGRITFVLVARIPKKDGRAGSRGRRVLGDYKPVDDRGQLRPTKSGGDALTFEGARQKAREWKSMIAQGKDPGAKATVVVAPAAPKSFEAVYNEFMKRHVRKEGQKDARGKHFLPLRSIERIITSF